VIVWACGGNGERLYASAGGFDHCHRKGRGTTSGKLLQL